MLDDRDYMKEKGSGTRRGGSGGSLSGTAILLIAILVVFFVQLNTNGFGGKPYFTLFVNVPQLNPIWMVIGFVTHMFMHNLNDYGHILFNGFALFIFGRETEKRLGKGALIRLFIGSGVISGIGFVLITIWSGQPTTLVGASGAIFGITAAAAMLAPNMEVLLFMTFPIKLKYLVPGYFIISILAFRDLGPTAHSAHAAGLVGGFLLMHAFHRNLIRWTPLPFLLKVGDNRSSRPKSPSKSSDENLTFGTVDQILDKIGKYGMKSLTKKEKRLLDQARKKMGKD